MARYRRSYAGRVYGRPGPLYVQPISFTTRSSLDRINRRIRRYNSRRNIFLNWQLAMQEQRWRRMAALRTGWPSINSQFYYYRRMRNQLRSMYIPYFTANEWYPRRRTEIIDLTDL
nr:hypothetical protein [Cressdnaviricota sp.]UOF81295.1 hypothetical protein [Cressdnaviricota sp.]